MIPILITWLYDSHIPIAFNRMITSKNITMKTIEAPRVEIENCNYQLLTMNYLKQELFFEMRKHILHQDNDHKTC